MPTTRADERRAFEPAYGFPVGAMVRIRDRSRRHLLRELVARYRYRHFRFPTRPVAPRKLTPGTKAAILEEFAAMIAEPAQVVGHTAFGLPVTMPCNQSYLWRGQSNDGVAWSACLLFRRVDGEGNQIVFIRDVNERSLELAT